MMRQLRRLAWSRKGAAAAEMAMVTPLLLILMFSTFELGNYFLSEHALQKAVRDASRYAARLPATNYNCATSPPAVNATAQQQIQRVAKAGDPDGDSDGDGTQDARLVGWTADSMAVVSVACDSGSLYSAAGVYEDFDNGAPVVTVDATVPYPTLFGMLGLGAATLNLNAQSQAAVFGA
jgi:Flp pilus assembly protein TadG